MVLLEHLAQLVIDALRQEDRHARADPDDLDVRDLAEAAEDRFEQLRRERQPVAARDEDVPNLRRPAQVLELRLVVAPVEVLGRVADDARPRAVATVRGALGRDEHQDTVRVAVHEPGHRGVAVLGERVLHHRGEGLLLPTGRDDLPTDGVSRVFGVDEADEVGRDVDAELARRGEAGALVVREVEDLLDLGKVVDPVTQLPAPVIPLGVGDVLPDRGAAADRGSSVGAERASRVGAVDERPVGEVASDVLTRGRGPDVLGVHLGASPRQCIKSMQSA